MRFDKAARGSAQVETHLDRFKMQFRHFLSACALAMPMPLLAQGTGIVSISPTLTRMSGIGIFIKSSSEPGSSVLAPTSRSVAAGERLEFNFVYAAEVAPKYSFLGAYGAGGVVVAVDSGIAASLIGRSWESIFSNPSFSEAVVNATFASFANSNPDDDDILGIVRLGAHLGTLTVDVDGTTRELFAPLGTESVLLNFSQAYANGTANLQPVPEPGTWLMALLGCGAIPWVLRRKRA